MGKAPKDDNLSTSEWTPLKGSPYDENLRLTRVSGNVSEFESRLGYRYRCVMENGTKQWFSFRTNQFMRRATRAQVKICCKKFERSWGTFVDRPNAAGNVRIFPKQNGLTSVLSSGIKFCPWCGQKLQFLESEETGESHARTAQAGAQH